MDSLQSPLNDQAHRDDIVSLVPGQSAAKARPGEPTHDADDRDVLTTISPELIDVTAEQTCPAAAAQMSTQDRTPHQAPATQSAQTPSKKTFELMDQLEVLAGDLADKGRASSDQRIEDVHEESSELRAVEPTIRVPPRSNDQFASDRPSIGRRRVLTLAGFFMVALIGLGASVAWHSHSVSTMTSPNDVDVVAEQPASAPASQVSAPAATPPQSAPVTQTATAPGAPATSPELVKQLEAMTRDLAAMRRSVEQLAAKQEQLAAAQQQLEQLAVKQEQLAAKREQTAQNIAKQQALEKNARVKMSPPPHFRAAPLATVAPIAPRVVPPEPAAQLSSVPRSAQHPVPPLPVPP